MTEALPVKPFSESRTSRERAAVIVAGVPLDATSSFRCGTRQAPAAVREVSWHLEDYSLADGRSILDASFFDAGDLHLTGDLQHHMDEIEAFAASVHAEGKKPLCIGGEHLITYPLVRAASARHEELHVVVFDAHTDLGDAYRKMRLSHAGVMKLVHEVVGDGRIYMFGPRSGTREDASFMQSRVVHSRDAPPDELLEGLRGRNVYLSVDVDVLDPSEAPGVSTPELLGWTYRTLDGVLRRMEGLSNIVGADVVEICPPFDPAGVTSLVGAGIVRTLLHLMDAG